MGNTDSSPSTATAASSNGGVTTAAQGRRDVINRPRPTPATRTAPRPTAGRRTAGVPAEQNPGAYSIAGAGSRTNVDSIPYTVTVPNGVRPGQEFQVMAGGLPMVVRCPPDVSGGSRIMVLVPRQHRQQQSRNAQVYMATVPPGVSPGGEFNVMVNSHPVRVACPPNVTPGMQIRIRLEEPHGALHQTFEVAVPPGVRPGQPFALIAGGQRVMVHCPHDARPGQKIRFQLPIQLSEAQLQ
ncbi:unnamed protein product, partial [Ectocarpus sp. 12 AP-2014]